MRVSQLETIWEHMFMISWAKANVVTPVNPMKTQICSPDFELTLHFSLMYAETVIIFIVMTYNVLLSIN